ncbi:MAG: hypothetical protein H0V68_08555 [Actinobacteria bacterium]|nr:hypothetical protein [Actinomycetota bacterium]
MTPAKSIDSDECRTWYGTSGRTLKTRQSTSIRPSSARDAHATAVVS